MAEKKKTGKQPAVRYVIKKRHNTKVGELKNSIEDLRDGTTAQFNNGTLTSVSVGDNKVMYADGQVANSVTLKNGNMVLYDTDFNGNPTTTVQDKDGNDITTTPEGKKAAYDALKTVLKSDAHINSIASHSFIQNYPAFGGLRKWKEEARRKFEARQSAAATRKKLLEVSAKHYANAEIAINSGASVEEVEKARKKDEKVAASKATALAKENIKIRDEQRAEDRATKLKMHEAYQKALHDRDY